MAGFHYNHDGDTERCRQEGLDTSKSQHPLQQLATKQSTLDPSGAQAPNGAQAPSIPPLPPHEEEFRDCKCNDCDEEYDYNERRTPGEECGREWEDSDTGAVIGTCSGTLEELPGDVCVEASNVLWRCHYCEDYNYSEADCVDGSNYPVECEHCSRLNNLHW